MPRSASELRNNALIAFGVAFLAQLLYLAIRFKWTFGVAAVLAMAHDVILVVGLFAWLQKPIDGIFLAAAMTIVGLSVNDTVVVFDRIRERWWGSKPEENFNDIANRAAVETIPRTVNTGLGAMFILAALAILGGDSLQDFAIALLVGLVVGTYSSVFVATPLLTYMQPKWPMCGSRRRRSSGRRRTPARSSDPLRSLLWSHRISGDRHGCQPRSRLTTVTRVQSLDPAVPLPGSPSMVAEGTRRRLGPCSGSC